MSTIATAILKHAFLATKYINKVNYALQTFDFVFVLKLHIKHRKWPLRISERHWLENKTTWQIKSHEIDCYWSWHKIHYAKLFKMQNAVCLAGRILHCIVCQAFVSVYIYLFLIIYMSLHKFTMQGLRIRLLYPIAQFVCFNNVLKHRCTQG
jgi:hypothetical protein